MILIGVLLLILLIKIAKGLSANADFGEILANLGVISDIISKVNNIIPKGLKSFAKWFGIFFILSYVLINVFLPGLYAFWNAPSPNWAFLASGWSALPSSGNPNQVFQDQGDGHWKNLTEQQKLDMEVVREKNMIILNNSHNYDETFTLTSDKIFNDGANIKFQFDSSDARYRPIRVDFSFMDQYGGDEDVNHPNINKTFYYNGWTGEQKIILKDGGTYSSDFPGGYISYPGVSNEKLIPDGATPKGRSYWTQFAFTLQPGQKLIIYELGASDSLFGFGVNVGIARL